MRKEKTLKVPTSQLAAHHGDTVIERINSIPEGAKKVKRSPLAYGETSGHSHVVVEDDVEFYQDENGVYLAPKGSLTVRHQKEDKSWTGEHNTMTFEKNETLPYYKIGIQRVTDPFTKRLESVRD